MPVTTVNAGAPLWKKNYGQREGEHAIEPLFAGGSTKDMVVPFALPSQASVIWFISRYNVASYTIFFPGHLGETQKSKVILDPSSQSPFSTSRCQAAQFPASQQGA